MPNSLIWGDKGCYGSDGAWYASILPIPAYACLDYIFKDEGYENVYVGTVEGFPTFDTIVNKLSGLGCGKSISDAFDGGSRRSCSKRYGRAMKPIHGKVC